MKAEVVRSSRVVSFVSESDSTTSTIADSRFVRWVAMSGRSDDGRRKRDPPPDLPAAQERTPQPGDDCAFDHPACADGSSNLSPPAGLPAVSPVPDPSLPCSPVFPLRLPPRVGDALPPPAGPAAGAAAPAGGRQGSRGCVGRRAQGTAGGGGEAGTSNPGGGGGAAG